MSSWQIDLSQDARRFLHELRDEKLKQRLGRKIDALIANPRPPGCEKLSGMENCWRIRVGDYQVIYTVYDNRLVILVIRIGHRREIYR